MRVSNIEFNQLVRFVRPKAARNNALAFAVKISQRTTAPLDRLEKLLEKITVRLLQAPYSTQIKTRSVNVWVLTKDEIKSLQLTGTDLSDIPTASAAAVGWLPEAKYSSRLNALVIDADLLPGPTRELEALVTNEILHALSADVREINARLTYVREGISTAAPFRTPLAICFRYHQKRFPGLH